MISLLQDIRYACRLILNSPGYAFIVILTLGLGIGPNTVIYTILDTIVLRPAPYERPEELVILNDEDSKTHQFGQVSLPNYEDWKSQNDVFASVAAYRQDPFNLRLAGNPVRISGQSVTSDFFRVLQVAPAIGRAFTDEDFRSAETWPVVISHTLWQKRFGGSPTVVGQSIVVDGHTGTVIGVMPPEFRSFLMAHTAQMWVPFYPRADLLNRAVPSGEVVARLKPGVTVARAQQQMTLVGTRLASAYPDANRGRTVRVRSMDEVLLSMVGPTIRILSAAVFGVLLVACANVANLLLARGVSRKRELAVRQALGAGRMRLIRQLLTETIILALLGGLFGYLLAQWGLDLLGRVMGDTFVELGIASFVIDWRVLRFTLAVALATGLFFGLVPALRTSKVHLSLALKSTGDRSASGRVKSRLTNGLVVAEIAISLVLLIAVSLFVRSYRDNIRANHSPGFRTANILLTEINLSGSRFTEVETRASFFRKIMDEVGPMRGVEQVSITSKAPGRESPGRVRVARGAVPAGGQESDKGIWVDHRVVSGDYFRSLAIPLQTGRTFSELDRPESAKVAVISQSLAQLMFEGKEAVGQIISVNAEPHSVIGVVGNVTSAVSTTERRPHEVYVPYTEACARAMTVIVRTSVPPASLAEGIRKGIQGIGPDESLSNVQTMDQYLDDQLSMYRIMIGMMSIFAVLALLIAAAGIYGVMSHAAAQRVPEIGIRLALGASRADVVRLVMRQGIGLTIAGLAIGLLLGVGVVKILPSAIFGLLNVGVLTFGSVTLLLGVVALAACYIPVRRATGVDPSVSLRCE